MSQRNPTDWMWAQACELIEQAERMHRQFFRLISSERAQAVWEPPVDVFEDEREVVDHRRAARRAGRIASRSTTRRARWWCAPSGALPFAGSRTAVRQLEIPYGYFERRIPLPDARLEVGDARSC